MIDPWLVDRLVCPRCRQPVHERVGGLRCRNEHRYPLVGNVPVMLLDDVRPTHWAASVSLKLAREEANVVPPPAGGPIDPIVQEAISATCGNLYKHLIGCLPRYPIPTLDMSAPKGTPFLDIGCHWGRWCVSAARKGWRVVGLDPYLPAIEAAQRIAAALGVSASFVVGDARYLPFASSTFEIVHSYSVLQHFAECDVRQSAAEIGRVLAPGGTSHIQMAQRFGLLNLAQQVRRGFRSPHGFEVRYWRGPELQGVFARAVGSTTIRADGFFSLNAQSADLDLLRPLQRKIVGVSDSLRQLSARWPWLTTIADSVYVQSVRDSRAATITAT
jgi:2-polyprenyl-3-methyl-5-hydroxy-6-metoxy-1,4-benzoquinol methylase/uncharacterized protein YbaR (Trm112 family)